MSGKNCYRVTPTPVRMRALPAAASCVFRRPATRAANGRRGRLPPAPVGGPTPDDIALIKAMIVSTPSPFVQQFDQHPDDAGRMKMG
jgi:hypothetical protein